MSLPKIIFGHYGCLRRQINSAETHINHGIELEIGKGCSRDASLRSAVEISRSAREARGLIVTYKDKQLPVKVILRMAYRLANNIPSETKLKFSSGEASLQFLRSLGFRAERLQTNYTVAEKD